MRKTGRSGYTQSYNAQAAVDVEGSQLILGNRISQSSSNNGELVKSVLSVPETIGKATGALADCGFLNADAFELVEKELGIDLYCSVHREDAHAERSYDYRPAVQPTVRTFTDPRLLAMKAKLQTPEGKAIYAKRNHTVETAFGIIKQAIGFRGFMLRGLAKVTSEWNLVCLTYNVKRLHNLTRQKAA